MNPNSLSSFFGTHGRYFLNKIVVRAVGHFVKALFHLLVSKLAIPFQSLPSGEAARAAEMLNVSIWWNFLGRSWDSYRETTRWAVEMLHPLYPRWLWGQRWCVLVWFLPLPRSIHRVTSWSCFRHARSGWSGPRVNPPGFFYVANKGCRCCCCLTSHETCKHPTVHHLHFLITMPASKFKKGDKNEFFRVLINHHFFTPYHLSRFFTLPSTPSPLTLNHSSIIPAINPAWPAPATSNSSALRMESSRVKRLWIDTLHCAVQLVYASCNCNRK